MWPAIIVAVLVILALLVGHVVLLRKYAVKRSRSTRAWLVILSILIGLFFGATAFIILVALSLVLYPPTY